MKEGFKEIKDMIGLLFKRIESKQDKWPQSLRVFPQEKSLRTQCVAVMRLST
jgi:hypothetical protein